jgi:cysteinyl-tRNA synthetase
MIQLYNSLTRKKERFTPIDKKEIGLYTCGPTVYHYAHIGNLRAFLFEDVLKRVLKYNGYKVKHVMNITDVGHLTDDADSGEDKMEKGARREGKTAWEIALFYEKAFKSDIEELNILEPNIWTKATDHIPEQIEMIDTLVEKGYTYETKDGIYFDTTKIDNYGIIGNLQNQDLQAGVRVDIGTKRNPQDFALWKFTPKNISRQMEWDSPYNSIAGKTKQKGFPGWHIECSAMSMKYLGEQFDIHCGGIDHKTVHHPNEIAQSEAVTGKTPWVNYWLHNEHLILLDNEKMSKSEGNFITLQTLKDKQIDPLSYRYFLLQAHYRKQITFSYEALEAAQNGLKKLRRFISNISPNDPIDPNFITNFDKAVNDDMNTAEALALLWKALKNKTIDIATVIHIDKVLGLNLHNNKKTKEIPENILTLLEERKQAREHKDWKKSDTLRDTLEEQGYTIKDTNDGQKII